MREDVKAGVPVSVLILTFNEEVNIAACLDSVRWVDEVFVVDSSSTDRTKDIAREMGAKVYEHPWHGFASQRNWALDNLSFSHDWVLILDADEVIPKPLAEEIGRTLRDPRNDFDGFYLNRRFFFLGQPLTHGSLFPSWQLRLYKRALGRFEERLANPHLVFKGKVGRLRAPFDHVDKHCVADWVAKHNTYADDEADEYLQERYGNGLESSIPARFWGDQPERKRWLKLRLWNRLPLLFRPFLFFFRNYFLKGGFLDGREGFIYHVLWSFWARFLIDVKIIEREIRGESVQP